MKSINNFKRGDTLLLTAIYKVDGVATSVSAIDIASQIRTNRGTLVATMSVTKLPATGQFTLSPVDPNTSAWPLGALQCDIEFSEGGNIRSTETFTLVVTQEITK